MKIKDVEEELKIDRASIRYYEKEGLFAAMRNPLNGYRDYSRENVETLKKIIFLRNLSFSIDDIRNIQEGKCSLGEITSKEICKIQTKKDKLEIEAEILNRMNLSDHLSYETLEVKKYDENLIQSDLKSREEKNLFHNTIKNLILLKDRIIPWIFIIISFFISVMVYPFLSEYIALEWSGDITITEMNKLFIFAFPVLLFCLTITIKSLILNFLYRNMIFALYMADYIADFTGNCIAVLLITYQVCIVYYSGGFMIAAGRVFFIEAAIAFLLFLYKYRIFLKLH